MQAQVETLHLELQQAIERKKRLKAILGTIRKINQLIIRENNRVRLIHQVCTILVEYRSYHNAWIALLDETGQQVVATADAGFDEGFAILNERLVQGEFPSCVKQSFDRDAVLIVKDPANSCSNCPVSREYTGRAGMVRCLRCEDRIYGVLAVSVHADQAEDTEEQNLFGELAEDIGFTLHKIELATHLREREAFLDALLNAIPIPVFYKNMQGMYLGFNKSFELFFGAEKEKLIGQTAFDINPPELAKVYHTKDIELYSTGGNQQYASTVRNVRGEIRDVIFNKSVFNDGRGNLIGLIGTIQDITERKIAEDEIRRNVDKLKAIIEILQYHPKNLQDFLDHALEKAMALTQSKIGYLYFYDENRREFILNTWSKSVTKECSVANPQTCYKLEQTGIWGEAVRQRKPILINDFQASHSLKKGYPKGHVHLTRFLTVPIVHDEKIVAVIGVANKLLEYTETDTLELTLLMDTIWKSVVQMKNNDKIRERERYLRKILETTADGFWLLDQNGRIVDVNETYCAMSGYSRNELLGLGIVELDVVETPADTFTRMKRIFTKGSDIFETRHRRKDGIIWAVEISTSWIDEDGGRFICFCRDLTDRKQAESKIRHLLKAESLGRMAGGIAHHYNNLLAVVMGNLELAMGDLPADSKPAKELADAMIATVRAAKLGALMLAYLGQTPSRQTPLDLTETCLAVLPLFKARSAAHILLETDLPESGPVVMANADQIKQILENLLDNAREAVGGLPGTITLKIRTVPATDIPSKNRRPVSFQADAARYVCLEVTDTGCGITEDAVEKLYDPFYSTRFTGRGLGLTVALGNIKVHGGCITVSSKPGKGSNFKVFLPIQSGLNLA